MENKKPAAAPETQVKAGQESNLPDEERRRILGNLAKGAFVAPLVLLVLKGGDSINYGY